MSPARGVQLTAHQPVIVWLTVCTRNRTSWLNSPEALHALVSIWRDDAMAWLTGDFLLMPDHMHAFCSPRDIRVPIEQWISYWKCRCTRRMPGCHCRWQRGAFHHRLRSREELREKWLYTMENPVRKGYVARWEEWPWRGKVHDLHW